LGIILIVIKMKWKYLTALSFINAVYIIIGGCIFYVIEHPQAEEKGRAATRNLIEFEKALRSMYMVVHMIINIATNIIHIYINNLCL
jgi:hypothetical protein